MSEFGPAFDRAQRTYDAQEPPEDWDCDDLGHQWRWLPGVAKDGTRFYKCKICGMEKEAP